MQFGLALSSKVLMFAQDMIRGRVDPNRISGYHDFKRKDVRLSVVLPFSKSGNGAAAYLEGLAPQSAHFKSLQAELAKLVNERGDNASRITLPSDLLLKPGRSEEHTSELQSLMRISYAVFCLKKKNKTTTQ